MPYWKKGVEDKVMANDEDIKNDIIIDDDDSLVSDIDPPPPKTIL